MAIGQRLVMAFAMASAIVGCDFDFARSDPIDEGWHRRSLLEGHLTHWLAVAPAANGFLRTEVTRSWQLRPNDSLDLVMQARLIFALISGYELSGDPRYLQAAIGGCEFLLRHFYDPVHGGWFRSVAPDGRVLNDRKDTYAHAFVIFALAHTFRVTKDDRYRNAALSTWRDVNANLRDTSGGFRINAPRDFRVVEQSRDANPVMHMFEALLVLYEATGTDESLAGARSVGRFVLSRLVHGNPDGSAYIEELYNEKWEPVPTEDGGYVELGHQWEWAYLLSIADARGLSGDYPQVAQRILRYAIKVGYDEVNGGTFNRAYADGTVDHARIWWQQSECLRTLAYFAATQGGRDLERRYEQTLEYVRDQFIDVAAGGWRMIPRSQCTPSRCPDEQPDPYHMTTMHLAAIAVAGRGKARR